MLGSTQNLDYFDSGHMMVGQGFRVPFRAVKIDKSLYFKAGPFDNRNLSLHLREAAAVCVECVPAPAISAYDGGVFS